MSSHAGIRPLADSVLDEVSGGGEPGYKDGRLSLGYSMGAALFIPGESGGVRYIDDAVGTGVKVG